MAVGGVYMTCYDTLRPVGKGAFGFVRLAQRKSDKQMVHVCTCICVCIFQCTDFNIAEPCRFVTLYMNQFMTGSDKPVIPGQWLF